MLRSHPCCTIDRRVYCRSADESAIYLCAYFLMHWIMLMTMMQLETIGNYQGSFLNELEGDYTVIRIGSILD